MGSQHDGCASARNKGTCDNRRKIGRAALEERVLSGLRDKLLDPDLIAAFVEEYQREYNKAMQADLAQRRLWDVELAKIEQSIVQLVEAIADGLYHPSMKAKMAVLEERKVVLQQDLKALGSEEPLRLHPGLSTVYRRQVEQLRTALNADETTRSEAIEVLRGLIRTIRLTPADADTAQSSAGESWMALRSWCEGSASSIQTSH